MGTIASTANVKGQEAEQRQSVKGVDFDWKSARYEAIATLVLNGLVSNTAYNYLPTGQLIDKTIEIAKALEAKFAATPAPPSES